MEGMKPGWRRVKFGDVVRLSKARSQDPLADGFERYVGLEHLEPGDLRIRSWGNVADGVTFTSVFRPGQVLFGKRRAYQRKVAVADFAGVCSGDIYVLETNDAQVLLPELLPFICQTDAFFEHAVGTSAGSLSPRTNWTSLADFEFALPSLENQINAVSLLSAIEDTSQELASTLACLKIVRQSMMASIGSEGRDDYGKKLSDVCTLITDGTHKTPTYTSEGVPFLRVTDIQSLEVAWSEVKRISEQEHRELQRRVAPNRGDVLLSKNGTIGIPRLVDWSEGFSIFVSLCLLRPGPQIRSDYLAEILSSPTVKAQFRKRSKQGTVTNLHLEEIRDCVIPVPELAIQDDLIAEFNNFKKIQAGIESRLKNLSVIKSLILNPGEEARHVQ